jgi:hypothetical protein
MTRKRERGIEILLVCTVASVYATTRRVKPALVSMSIVLPYNASVPDRMDHSLHASHIGSLFTPSLGISNFFFFSKLDTHYVVAVLLNVFRPIVK